MIDYHTHHRRCGHAVGELEEYVREAMRLGVTELGLSDHQPVLHLKAPELLPEVAMKLEELPRYVEEVLLLKEKYKDQIAVKLGLEADYVEGYEEQTEKLLRAYPFDYVIGSVHFLGAWDLTDARQMQKWKQQPIAETWNRYYQNVQRAAKSGLFDVLGHIDVVKRFGFLPEYSVSEVIDETLNVIANSDVAVEVNTSGLRYPCSEQFPAQSLLTKLVGDGVPLTIGSDAHKPEHVAKDFEAAAAVIRQAGGSRVIGFTGRKRTIALEV